VKVLVYQEQRAGQASPVHLALPGTQVGSEFILICTVRVT